MKSEPLKNWKTAATFEKVDQLDSGHSSFCLFLVQIPPQAFLLINACFSCSSKYISYITDLRIQLHFGIQNSIPHIVKAGARFQLFHFACGQVDTASSDNWLFNIGLLLVGPQKPPGKK